MIGKFAGWVLTVFLCAILLTGVYWWRILTVGADGFRTTIELQQNLTTQDLQMLGEALDSALVVECKNRNDTQVCFRWRVGELDGDSVYVEAREIVGTTKILVNSLPYYLLGIGPSWIRQDHVMVEDFLVTTLAGNVKSVFQRRLPE